MTEASEVERALDRLFALPLTEFVAARNALAADLRAEAGAEAAEAVKQLRKPSLPAWAVNQLARRHPERIAALLEATERSRRAAQAQDGEALRASARERNEIVGELVRLAADVLVQAGSAPSRAHLDRVRDTLLAATDETHADLLRRGRISETLAPGGFEAAFGAPPEAPDPAAERAAAAEAARRRADRLEAEAARADARAARLEAEAEAAVVAARRARAAADEAEAEAARARAEAR
jgi:hypothetical protein